MLMPLSRWLQDNEITDLKAIAKETDDTQAWFATVQGEEAFLKFFPKPLIETRATVEIAIAGHIPNLHPAIVPLRQSVPCADGVLLIYNRVAGENLGPMETRKRFGLQPLTARLRAVRDIFAALAAIYHAGFMLVDWYEGNMIYDFARQQIWLFDWELCLRGSGFVLEMENNYGSSRLMAPEEFVRGSWLDGQTIVYNLGRYALITLPELADPLAPLLARATYPARAGRYRSPSEFVQAFTVATE